MNTAINPTDVNPTNVQLIKGKKELRVVLSDLPGQTRRRGVPRFRHVWCKLTDQRFCITRLEEFTLKIMDANSIWLILYGYFKKKITKKFQGL
jgi:hypothetical protein